MTSEAKIGDCILRTEAPDILFLESHGDLDESTMSGVLDGFERLTAGMPYFFLLIDVEHVATVSSVARKLAVERMKAMPMRGIFVYGASFRQRVLAQILASLIQLVGKYADNPIGIFDSAAKARAALAERRKAIVAP